MSASVTPMYLCGAQHVLSSNLGSAHLITEYPDRMRSISAPSNELRNALLFYL